MTTLFFLAQMISICMCGKYQRMSKLIDVVALSYKRMRKLINVVALSYKRMSKRINVVAISLMDFTRSIQFSDPVNFLSFAGRAVQIRGNQDKLVGKVWEEISKVVLRGLFTGLLCRLHQI